MDNDHFYINAYCKLNFGDDLFIKTLVDRYPDRKFYICASKRELPFIAKSKNLITENRLSFFYLKVKKAVQKYPGRVRNDKRLKSAQAVIKIGGSIFIEYKGWRNNQYVEDNSNIFILGANFGPYNSPEFLEVSREKILRSTDCCFRDMYSFNMFKDFAQVRYAPDILFGYKNYPEQKDGECIGISVINYENRDHGQEILQIYEKGIIDLCEHYRKQNKVIKLLGFCEAEGDKTAIERIVSKITNKKGINIVLYDGNIDLFLHEINSCCLIYATRFHAMIIGWALKKEVVPIIYSQKQLHVMEDIAYDKPHWNLLAGESLPKNCFDVQGTQLEDITLERLKTMSDNHFKVLDMYDFSK